MGPTGPVLAPVLFGCLPLYPIKGGADAIIDPQADQTCPVIVFRTLGFRRFGPRGPRKALSPTACVITRGSGSAEATDNGYVWES